MRDYRLSRAGRMLALSGLRQEVHLAEGVPADPALLSRLLTLFRRHRVRGAVLTTFDRERTDGILAVGDGGSMGPVTRDTWFRTASISKMVSAALFLHGVSAGAVSLGADAGGMLGTGLRHPGWPESVITPAMLLSHTAGIRDGEVLEQGVRENWDLETVVSHLSFLDQPPGKSFAYSNVGAGLCGAALSLVTGRPLDQLFRECFGTEGIYEAGLVPARAALADGIRILPPSGVRFDAARRRQAAPIPLWARAHGSLCITAEGLSAVTRRIMTREEFALQLQPVVSFGQRDPALEYGLGMFIVHTRDGGIVRGHQGLAYGACHGVFFDGNRGFVFLTSGCDLSRRYVLSDLNRALISCLLGREVRYG